MHTILRFFIRLLIILAALFLIVLGLGTYKFNYSNRDIHMVNNATSTTDSEPQIKIDSKTMQFGVVANDFEGEADSSKMNLTMKTWNWEKIVYNNDTEIVPKTNKFTLTLKKDKTFSAKTDCNGIGGEYSVAGKKIKFDKMMSTLMYCEGSQEQEFSKALGEADGFFFTSKGELVITLKADSGSIIFK